MRRRLLAERFGGRVGVFLVLAGLVACGLLLSIPEGGDDLASSYIGCRLLATDQAGDLYAHDSEVFSDVGANDPWQEAADLGHFSGYLHPYVQTPLWAWSLRPLCGGGFGAFRWTFAALTMLAFASLIYLLAHFWAPELLGVLPIAAVSLLLFLSEPFHYAIFLTQTHVLYLVMTVGALILAERDREGWAGLLLAGAAAVKITPGFFVLYWLLRGRWRAAGSAAAWSVALWIAAVAATGRDTMAAYVADLHWVSSVLLLSQNNQSLAAWWMGHFYPWSEFTQIRVLPLPAMLRVWCLLLTAAAMVAGGWLDRRAPGERRPWGAMLGLVASTIFVPIAWTHYFIVLVAPCMLLAGEALGRRSQALWLALMAIVALNLRPFATDVIAGEIGRGSVLRGQFFAGVLCLGAMGYAAALAARTHSAEEAEALEERFERRRDLEHVRQAS